MPNYYLNTNAQPTGEHEVHVDDNTCTHPPLLSNREPLGWSAGCRIALDKAKAKYPKRTIDGCKYCIPACHKI